MQSPALNGMNQKLPQAARVMSSSSMVSEALSIGTTISNSDQPDAKEQTSVPSTEAYEAALKIVLLQYKNEPRFQTMRHSPTPSRPGTPASIKSPSIASPSSSSSDSRSKHHSWFHRSSSNDPDALPKDALTKLKQMMLDIAMGRNKSVTDPLTKRCFLHLYNDLLKPGATVPKAEELVVLFIGVATKEIQLCNQPAADIKGDVYHQTNVFISLFLGILKTCKSPERSMNKLKEYQKDLKAQNSSNRTKSSSSSQVNSSHSQLRPSYRLNEISAAKILGEIFDVDEIKLQQDVIRLKDVAQESVLLADLLRSESLLKSNEFIFNPDDFDSYDAYFSWKKQETTALSNIINKLGRSSTVQPSVEYKLIPNDPRSSIAELFAKFLQYETFKNTDTLISNSTKTLLDSCCLYWRINEISQACLLYQAAHKSILKDEYNELDPTKTEALFGILFRLFGDDPSPKLWPKSDKKTWITNISNTYIQVMSSLRISLMGIYAHKSPKFTPILKILFEYVETDPFFDVLVKSGLPQRWLKRLKNTVLSTTEKKYIEMLQSIPRDSSLDLIHIKDTAQAIYKNIQLLQKKFPKPLLDEIYIANEAGFLFIKLFGEDVKNMLGHIEHYTVKSGKQVDYVDALEAYSELRDLRDIFEQVSPPASKFPLNLEKFFFKYLDEFADFTCKKFLPVVKESLQHDTFEPLDLQNDRGFSSSVLDIFKMINETFTMFKNYDWANGIQIAYIYTKLLKSMSDSLVYYTVRILRMCIEDLKDEEVVESEKEQTLVTPAQKKSNWLFNEMKATISTISTDSKLVPPAPFSFKMRTCVALNNLSQMTKMLNELESQIDPEKIKDLVSGVDTYKKDVNNVFTIRVLRAENIKPCGGDGLSSAYAVLVDTSQRKEIGKTKIVPKTLNPVFEEEFEIETQSNSTKSITVTVWDHSSKIGSQDLCGRALLQLDPRKLRNDGIPEEISRDLDIQGTVVFQVSLESEKDDAIFSLGKAYRSIKRTMDRIYSLIVQKFTVFINHSFSRHTLKSICGGSGVKKPTEEEANDAIVPLFDYLNSNLQILAGTLNHDILVAIMLQTWKVVLISTDNLLLPALASVKVLAILSNNATWKNSLTSVMANVTNSVVIPGYGRALTQLEVDVVFIWLTALIDFFHNDGAGPPLEDLKEVHYQILSLIPQFYHEDTMKLKNEVDRLTPLVLKAIKAKNFLGDEEADIKSRKRSNTIARSKTILAYGSSKRRQETQKAVEESEHDTSSFQMATEDIILRVLLAKDEKDFVNRRLTEREKIAKSIATERLAKLAVQGIKNNH